MKKSMFTLLMTGVLFVGGAVPVQADSEKYQVDEIKSIQDGIVSWEKDQMGIDGKNLLDGVVLESAGTSAGDGLHLQSAEWNSRIIKMIILVHCRNR